MKNVKETKERKTISLAAVVVANLVPLVMALLGYWGVGEILLLYWLETGIVGVFTILRVLFAAAPGPAGGRLTVNQLRTAPASVTLPLAMAQWGIFGKLLLSLFFAFPYALFMVMQGYILYIFMAIVGPYGWPLPAVKWGLLALFGSHALGFAVDYLASGEFRRTGAEECVQTPFHRLAIMQIVLGCGGWASSSFGHTAYIMSVFVLVKLVIDLRPAKGYV